MSTSNTSARRVFALLALTLLLPAVLPAAGSHPPKATPAESFWSHPVQSLWRLALSAACVLDSNLCPGPTTKGGCEKGISIDPNGGCAQ
jgi:hypothetical protein